MDNSTNPEQLHEKAKNLSKSVTTPSFVNEGTPMAPLASEADLISPTIKGGSEKLQSHIQNK